MRKINHDYTILWLVFTVSVIFVFFLVGVNKHLKRNIFDYTQVQNKIHESSDAKKKMITSETINSSTKITYKYRYQEDNITETMTEMAPKFLIGLNEQDLKNTFSSSEWHLNKFSPEEIILQKNLPGKSNQHYIIGIKDGYVAVFYQKKINGCDLKEITNTPIKSLSLEDQNRLKVGIKISGENNLFSVMQDYES